MKQGVNHSIQIDMNITWCATSSLSLCFATVSFAQWTFGWISCLTDKRLGMEFIESPDRVILYIYTTGNSRRTVGKMMLQCWDCRMAGDDKLR